MQKYRKILLGLVGISRTA